MPNPRFFQSVIYHYSQRLSYRFITVLFARIDNGFVTLMFDEHNPFFSDVLQDLEDNMLQSTIRTRLNRMSP